MVAGMDEPNVQHEGSVPADISPASCSTATYEGSVTDNQLSSSNDYQLISTFLDIRCFCHLNLLDAKIKITHVENTGAVVLWLLSGDNVVLKVRTDFDYVHNQILVNSASYGFAEPQHSIRTPINDCIHFFIHVYHETYWFEVNGVEMLRLAHKLPFHYVQPIQMQRYRRSRRRFLERRKCLLPY